MDVKRILEKILLVNSKILPKYRKITQKWWREPEEDYLLAEFGSRIFAGMAIFFWFLSSISIVFAITNYLSKQHNVVVGWGVAVVILTLVGLAFLRSSNEQRRICRLEKLKYEEAKMNKPSVERRMSNLCAIAEKNIADLLTASLKNTQNLTDLIVTIDDTLVIVSDSQRNIKDVYYSNKVYTYNVNEPFEVDAFNIVDAFKECEILMERLEEIIIILNDLRMYAINENEVMFASRLEVLFDFIGK